jgi:hypothetical protein
MTTPAAPAVRSFSTLEAASAAMEALAAAGLPKDAVQLTVLEDEAGPAAGNFLVGNGETTHGGAPSAVRAGRDVPYDENFRAPANRGGFLLTLHGLDAAQLARADATLSPFDCVAVEDVAAAAQAGGGR